MQSNNKTENEYRERLVEFFEDQFKEHIESGQVRIQRYPFGMPIERRPDFAENLIYNHESNNTPIPFTDIITERKYNIVIAKEPDGNGLSDDDVQFCIARAGCWMYGYVHCESNIDDIDKNNVMLTIICSEVDSKLNEKINKKGSTEIKAGVRKFPEYEGFPITLIEVSKINSSAIKDLYMRHSSLSH